MRGKCISTDIWQQQLLKKRTDRVRNRLIIWLFCIEEVRKSILCIGEVSNADKHRHKKPISGERKCESRNNCCATFSAKHDARTPKSRSEEAKMGLFTVVKTPFLSKNSENSALVVNDVAFFYRLSHSYLRGVKGRINTFVKKKSPNPDSASTLLCTFAS